MERYAEKPSLREASCCSVEVVKGGFGLRRAGLLSTEETEKRDALMRDTISEAVFSFGMSNLPSFLPSSATRRATKGSPVAVFISVSTVQYSWLLKASISSSRSQMRRSATDCTRPAEREPGSFRQRTGERVKPTR